MPCGNGGADPTSTTVFRVIAALVAWTSARRSGLTGTRIVFIPKYSAALSNAACAVVGAMISGSVMCCLSRARSR
jgi:hypothetical protein